MVPVLPYIADEYGASGTTLGVLVAGYAAAQFVCAPLWGRLSDRIGRRPVLLFTVAGTAISLAGLGLATSLVGIFVARVLGGAFAANISVASAYITDVTSEEERTRWMGLLGASFAVGFTLGPALGGGLSLFGYEVPMLVAAAMGGLNWIHALVRLREPERAEARDSAASDSAAEGSGGRFVLLRDPVVRRLCLVYFAFSVAVTQLETVFAYFMLHRFGYDAWEVAIVLVGMAVVMGGIQGGGMRALSQRFPERRLVVSGTVILALGLGLAPGASTVAWLIVPLTLAAVGRAIAQPPLMSLASFAAAEDQRGSVMGTFQSSASLARVVGPLAAGWLYDQAVGLPFWLAAVLLGVAALGARGLPRGAGGSAGEGPEHTSAAPAVG